MPSAFKRESDGRWIASWKDEHGRWRQTSGATSKADTERKARRLEREALDKGRSRLDENPFERHALTPIGEHVEAYIASLRQRKRGASYVAQVGAILRRVLEEAEIASIDKLDPVIISEAIAGMSKAQWKFSHKQGKPIAASDRTKVTYIIRVRGFARWLVKARRLQINPLDALESIESESVSSTRPRRSLTSAEAGRLLDAAELRPTNELRVIRRGPRKGQMSARVAEDVLAAARHTGLERRTAYLAALWTGLRRSELEALQWGDLRDDAGRMFIQLRAQATKSRRADRVPVHPELHEALRRWRSATETQAGSIAPESVVFGCIPSMAVLKRDLRAAEIPYEVKGRGVADFHALRKTYSSLMAAAKLPQRIRQAAMRHSDPRLTESVYMDEEILPIYDSIAGMASFRVNPT